MWRSWVGPGVLGNCSPSSHSLLDRVGKSWSGEVWRARLPLAAWVLRSGWNDGKSGFTRALSWKNIVGVLFLGDRLWFPLGRATHFRLLDSWTGIRWYCIYEISLIGSVSGVLVVRHSWGQRTWSDLHFYNVAQGWRKRANTCRTKTDDRHRGTSPAISNWCTGRAIPYLLLYE